MSAKHRELVAHYIDLMTDVADVRAKPMFGGYGLYANDIMFALVDAEGDLYLKADDENEPEFERAGCPSFVHVAKSGRISRLRYRRAPAATLDDRDAMTQWARLGIEASDRAAQAAAGQRKRKNRR